MDMLLSTAYMGNIQYFSKLATGRAVIEAHENFQKQTTRNHCRVMTAGGVRTLTVPVVWDHYNKMPIGEVKIDYTMPWQRTHWRTIHAAYSSSPYFGHYAGHVERMICSRRYGRLVELNNETTAALLGMLGIEVPLRFTGAYSKDTNSALDFRDTISYKPRLERPDPCFEAPEYYQVFSESLPFAPNLSVLDLIFCEGPQAGRIARDSFTG